MSHLPERSEKICLNCKSVIYGRFCHTCGQQNTEPKETFWGLITHFVYDITHFDGKFFDTAKHLLFRPGYLAYEYLRGRRASYLNPIRMYVFTSAFFFILFFSFIAKPEEEEKTVQEQRVELMKERKYLEAGLAKETDPEKKQKLQRKLNRVNNRIRYAGQTGIVKVADDAYADSTQEFSVIGDTALPKTVKAYDSIQASLPANKRNGWLKNIVLRKIVRINDKYRYDGREFWRRANEKFTHSIPQMMFVSLPLVALILQLLYLRRKQYYYVNHLIFTLNLYIAIYILLLVFYAFAFLYGWTGSHFFEALSIASWLFIFIYVYKSMRNFYQQRRAKTFLKYILFLLLFFIMMLLLMAIYFLTSASQI